MEQEINGLLFEIDHAIENAHEVASALSAGIVPRPGSDKIDLTITKLREARMWLAEAQRVIEKH